jgi:hypothetical protein
MSFYEDRIIQALQGKENGMDFALMMVGKEEK